jgi:hypothetical protein
VLAGHAQQIERPGGDPEITAAQLAAANRIDAPVTEYGLRSNIAVSIRYLEAWLRGSGSVRLFGLMEGVATVEIARSQIWQWLHHGTRLHDGRRVTRELVRAMLIEEIEKCRGGPAEDGPPSAFEQAKALFEEVAMHEDFPDFLTLPGYARLNRMSLVSHHSGPAGPRRQSGSANPLDDPLQQRHVHASAVEATRRVFARFHGLVSVAGRARRLARGTHPRSCDRFRADRP